MPVTVRDARAGPAGAAKRKAAKNTISGSVKGRRPSPFTFLESAKGSKKAHVPAKAVTKEATNG
jgi:hypothetical protein